MNNFNISDQPGGGGGAVSSVFGRTGAVVAVAGDYDMEQITGVGVAVTHSVAQSIPDSTTTTLNFDGEDFDTDGFHDNVTDNERLTVPAGLAGKYIIGMDLEWEESSGGQFRKASFILNGVTTIGVDSFRDVGSGADDQNYNTLTIVRDLSVGDFIEIDVLHDEGAAIDVNATSDYSPKFWMMQVGF